MSAALPPRWPILQLDTWLARLHPGEVECAFRVACPPTGHYFLGLSPLPRGPPDTNESAETRLGTRKRTSIQERMNK